jgi:TolB-like protein/class 3 adenylate cyclase/rhodanese-related sulfurtransferase
VSEEGVERRLTTILAADVVGYSRLMAADEAGTLASLKAIRRELIEPKTVEYHGRVVKLMGDGTLMEFGSVVDAVNFAVDVQQALEERNAKVPEDRRITFRIGINIGDIIVEGDDIYGDGVNIAARLEGLAEPGGICVARNVFNQVRAKVEVEVGFEDLGAQNVKNIPEPVQVFKVLLDSPVGDQVAVAAPAAKRSLRWPLVAGGLALLVIAAGIALWQRPWTPDMEPASVEHMAFPLPDRPSIAVLPFTNMSDDPDQEYFADGMAEDLITDLSKISGLFVIARNSSFSYKGQQVKVRQVAEELGVRYVLEGSVRRAGNEVRINAQLIDATTGGHLWAERYDGTLQDVFAFQDQVTEKIVAALAVNLTGAEQAQQARRDTDNAEAHDAYLQGWARYRLLTPNNLAEAVPFFDEAIRLDPNYAQAHAALASLYWDAYVNDWAFDLDMPSSRAESRANEHLEEALKAPTPLGHAVQSRMFASFGFPDEALIEAEKAVALNSSDATALAGLASALVQADRPKEGLGTIEQAMRLDPHHPPNYLITLGAAQFGMEKFEEAAATFARAVKRNPDNELPLIYLAASYGHLGRIRDGDAAIEAANDLRDQAGLGGLSLERDEQQWYSPFQGEVDFTRTGGKTAQDRVRAGLSVIPALKWQYLVIPHPVLGINNTWWEVEGATTIDVATAKSFHDRGVIFIDTSVESMWKAGHIPGTVHLPIARPKDPAKKKFKDATLVEAVDKSEEVVFYGGTFGDSSSSAPFACAKALTWGFTRVYYFGGGLHAWNQAGYPVETAQ